MNDIEIRVWVDGTWQETDEEPYTFMSDDYYTVKTSICERCEEIIVPEINEPYASCKCCTMEFYKKRKKK